MYRESRERRSGRSRSRKKKNEIGDPDVGLAERAQIEGNVHFRWHGNVSKSTLGLTSDDMFPAEENSLDLDLRCASSKKPSRIPIKTLIEKEISNKMEIGWSSPNLIARLMGLDSLPHLATKQQKERGIGTRKRSSIGIHKDTGHEGYRLRTANEYKDCKDVFEVMEMLKVEKQNDNPSYKGMPSLEQSEIDLKSWNIDSAIANQKFMDAAQLSADDEFHHSKEYNNALEDLDSNKGLFVKFLREPNSLFRKHLKDMRCSPPSPHGSHITILKPSRVPKSENELYCKSEKDAERLHCLLKGDMRPFRRPVSNLVGHSIEEDGSCVPCKLSEQLHKGIHLQPTQIVVLKPSLQKVCDSEKTVPLSRSPDYYRHDPQRQKRIPMSRGYEFYARQKDRGKLSDSAEVLRHETKELREIARDITKQLRTSRSSGPEVVAGSRKHSYTRNESTRGMSGMEDLNLESLRWTCDQLDDYVEGLSTPSYYSTESSVSRKARKHLSDRWKMTQKIDAVRHIDKGSSTLGEMLISEREMPRTILNTSVIQKALSEKVSNRRVLERWDYPLSISSTDEKKDKRPGKLLRSKSLPDSSLGSGKRKPSKRNRVGVSSSIYLPTGFSKSSNDSLVRNDSQRRKSSIQNLKYHHNSAPLCSSIEETEMPEREIHVNPEHLHSKVHEIYYPEAAHMVFEPSNDPVAGIGCEGGDLVRQYEGAKLPFINDDEQVQLLGKLAVTPSDRDLSGADASLETKKAMSINHHEVNCASPFCDVAESHSPTSSKEDQPSPVSVLEMPVSEEDKSTSDCFEKISADLKELRLQLKLLKLQSTNMDTEDLELVSSDEEDIGGECNSSLNPGEISEAFRDNKERDFSYLLDVLIDSDVHCPCGDGLSSACYPQKYTVGSEVFERLEKKYNVLAAWSRSDRKLLFDLVSSDVLDIITPSANLRKSMSCLPCTRESLIEDVCQLVVKQRQETSGKQEEKLSLEPRWLELGSDVDVLGSELENALMDELMEELLYQLI